MKGLYCMCAMGKQELLVAFRHPVRLRCLFGVLEESDQGEKESPCHTADLLLFVGPGYNYCFVLTCHLVL